MNQLLEDLIKVMTLERLEMNLFRGQSRDIGSPQVFGGQVLGQALVAATATAEDRVVHSLHAYFLRRGDFNSPIVYEVDRALGRQAFLLAARGRHSARPADLQHVGLLPIGRDRPGSSAAHARRAGVRKRCRTSKRIIATCAERLAARGAADAGTEASVRIPAGTSPPTFCGREKSAPLKYVWFRAIDKLPDDEALHRCLLAYVSDFHLLDTALKPHGICHDLADSW